APSASTRPSTSTGYSGASAGTPASGIASGANRGTPMATSKPPSSSARTRWLSAGLSSTNSPDAAPSRTSQAATQRAPLPHWRDGEPSAFQIPYAATAPGVRGAAIVRIWSQPTPRWRSAISRQRAGSGGGAPLRRSSTTKSLPAPCILLKRRPAGAAAASTASGAATAGVVDRGLVALAIDVRPGIVDGIGHRRGRVLARRDRRRGRAVGGPLLGRPGRGRRQQRPLVAAGREEQRGRQDGGGQQGADVHGRSLARRRFRPHPQPRAHHGHAGDR